MTKRDLVVRIAADTGMNQAVISDVVQRTLDGIVEAIARGRHVEFRDFGVFDICTRKPRVGRNPKRPEHVVRIPERKVVTFKPGKQMKARVLDLSPEPAEPTGPVPPFTRTSPY